MNEPTQRRADVLQRGVMTMNNDELAERLETMAKKAETEAQAHTDAGRRCYCEGQAQAWRVAARMLKEAK